MNLDFLKGNLLQAIDLTAKYNSIKDLKWINGLINNNRILNHLLL